MGDVSALEVLAPCIRMAIADATADEPSRRILVLLATGAFVEAASQHGARSGRPPCKSRAEQVHP